MSVVCRLLPHVWHLCDPSLCHIASGSGLTTTKKTLRVQDTHGEGQGAQAYGTQKTLRELVNVKRNVFQGFCL